MKNVKSVYDLLKLLLKIEQSLNSAEFNKKNKKCFIKKNLMLIESETEELMRYANNVNERYGNIIVLKNIPQLIRSNSSKIEKDPELLAVFLRKLRKMVLNNIHAKQMIKTKVQKQNIINKLHNSKEIKTLPLFNPKFNLREIVKQTILLNDQLSDKGRICRDCVCKHLLTIEALADEAPCLNKKLCDYKKHEKLLKYIPKKTKKLITDIRMTSVNNNHIKLLQFCNKIMNTLFPKVA